MKDRQRYPNEHFVRFMADNYYAVADRSRIRVLDIGSGGGANSWYPAQEGFTVVALDKDAAAMESLRNRFEAERFYRDRVTYSVGDICASLLPENHFDVVADINTLCHVPAPPMFAIHDSVRKGGKFFCIAPADDTWRARVGDGKDYTRFTDRYGMRELLQPFSLATIGRASYPHRGHDMVSWICEAQT